jgi:UDP-GlcNAc3NAcA epimerase
MPLKKIASIVGARPQFIKVAAISRALRRDFPDAAEEIIIHTGQHYDDNMSKVFFDELEIPDPKYNLGVGSGSHGSMTAGIIQRTEEVLIKEEPDMVLVFGDTNTTLGGALAAAKLHIPIAHVEAGLRSFNKTMPEEVNRVLCDHVSTLLFSPTQTGVDNLLREGFDLNARAPHSADNPKVFHCGDVMYDNAVYFSAKAGRNSSILHQLGLEGTDYVLCTFHRDSNTDVADRLMSILEALDGITQMYHLPVVIPVHPRTAKMIASLGDVALIKKLKQNPLLIQLPPVGYLDMLLLEKHARIILTDSGGVQKESYFFQKPCIVLRGETEWTELVEHGAAVLAGTDQNRILEAFQYFFNTPPGDFPPLYGNGRSASFICSEIFSFFNNL